MGGIRNQTINGIMIPSNPDTVKGSTYDFIHNTSHGNEMNRVGNKYGEFDNGLMKNRLKHKFVNCKCT